MGNVILHAFIGKVRDSRRLLYGDLQRLQRDVLPNGPATHAEAEALIGLDVLVERADNGWPGYLAAALRAFALSASTPPGSIDRATAEWLVAALGGLPYRKAVSVAREIVREAQHTHQVLLNFAGKGPRGKARPRAAAACRRASDPCVSCLPGSAYEWGSISVTVSGPAELKKTSKAATGRRRSDEPPEA